MPMQSKFLVPSATFIVEIFLALIIGGLLIGGLVLLLSNRCKTVANR